MHEHLRHYNQGGYEGQAGAPCDLLPIDQAISESLHRMQMILGNVQEFLEFKKSMCDFPDEATLQMFL